MGLLDPYNARRDDEPISIGHQHHTKPSGCWKAYEIGQFLLEVVQRPRLTSPRS
jgi:hypothetical protein